MTEISFTDVIGYLASFVVLFSFLMKEIKMLRIVNIFGCGLFVAYGILLDYVWPLIITNTAIVVINSYYLWKKSKS